MGRRGEPFGRDYKKLNLIVDKSDTGNKTNLPDVSLTLGTVVVLSEKAIDLLGPLFHGCCEVLDVNIAETDSYYAGFNVTECLLDIWVRDESQFVEYENGNIFVRKPVFDYDKISNHNVFLFLGNLDLYVGEPVREIAEVNGLTGFDWSNKVPRKI